MNSYVNIVKLEIKGRQPMAVTSQANVVEHAGNMALGNLINDNNI